MFLELGALLNFFQILPKLMIMMLIEMVVMWAGEICLKKIRRQSLPIQKLKKF